jgi:hypothetical protein
MAITTVIAAKTAAVAPGYTYDPDDWDLQASAADNSWYSVCWSLELSLFCAVTYSGTGDRVMTSQATENPPNAFTVPTIEPTDEHFIKAE